MGTRLLTLLAAVAVVASACASDEVASEVSQSSSQTLSDVALVSDRPETLAITEQLPDAPTDSESSEADTRAATDAADPDTEVGVQTDSGNVDTPAIEPRTCSAPALQGHFVDVELDDPDGGLNLRESAGSTTPILTRVERGNQLIPTGECDVVGSTDWWQVTNSDGSLLGWVSSNFLSDTVILSPGIGRAEPDLDNVGLMAETIDGLAAQLAIIYGFSKDVVITQVGDLEGIDASSGIATYDLTGLQDDSTSGYRVEILFFIERGDNADAVTGFSVTAVDRRSLCSRGVTDDGLCV